MRGVSRFSDTMNDRGFSIRLFGQYNFRPSKHLELVTRMLNMVQIFLISYRNVLAGVI